MSSSSNMELVVGGAVILALYLLVQVGRRMRRQAAGQPSKQPVLHVRWPPPWWWWWIR